jgi:hypothetical protein
MAKLKVGSLFQQAWPGVVNPMRFKVLEIDEKRDYLRVECIGTNGYTHDEEWQGPGDGLTFTEHCIDIGEYEMVNIKQMEL